MEGGKGGGGSAKAMLFWLATNATMFAATISSLVYVKSLTAKGQ